jgi:hypothetical protein
LNTLPSLCCEFSRDREPLLAVSAAQAPGDHLRIRTEDIALKYIWRSSQDFSISPGVENLCSNVPVWI